VQVEYRSGLLAVREEILQFLGNPVVSVFGSRAARHLDLSDRDVGVVLIGHGAPWEERSRLIAHFKRSLPAFPSLQRYADPTSLSRMRISTVPPTTPQNGPGWSGEHSVE
jgi:hypothetical protein